MVKNFFVFTGLILFTLQGAWAQETEAKSLLPDAFYQAMQQNSPHLIFDVRDNTFYKKHKIPGALHMPDKATLHNCTDTLDRDTPLFVYCEVGFMSRIVSNLLIEEGFSTVYTLEKGINRWHKMGFPVEKVNKKKKRKD